MAELIYSSQALTDLDRSTDFLLEADPASAPETTDLILEAVRFDINAKPAIPTNEISSTHGFEPTSPHCALGRGSNRR